jgi:hypothetical protein
MIAKLIIISMVIEAILGTEFFLHKEFLIEVGGTAGIRTPDLYREK